MMPSQSIVMTVDSVDVTTITTSSVGITATILLSEYCVSKYICVYVRRNLWICVGYKLHCALCGMINCTAIYKLLNVLWPMIKSCAIYKVLCRQLYMSFSHATDCLGAIV